MDPQKVGFESWLDCYQYLQKLGFHNEASVVFHNPPVIKSVIEHENGPKISGGTMEVVIPMTQIKAMAFDELYERLPMLSTIQVVVEMTKEIGCIHQCERGLAPLVEFLNKTPTRSL